MKPSKTYIPHYEEINDFLEALPVTGRTTNPLYYCMRLKNLDPQQEIYQPPFKRSFYFFGLFLNSNKNRIRYDDKTVDNPEAYLICHSPELISSFSKSNALECYIFYFKPECFSFFKPGFHEEFPFFSRLHLNLFTLNGEIYHRLAPQFDEVCATYARDTNGEHMEARLKLLALLYRVKEVVNTKYDPIPVTSPGQILLEKYLRLVDSHYINKRTVKEYAELLSVTPNYLSQSIKAVSHRNALSFISDRLLREAKSLLRYTHLDVSEIRYRLGFSDSANFCKFFKKAAGMTPSQYRDTQKAVKLTE